MKKFLIVVLVLAFLGESGYLVYDKVLNKETPKKVEKKEEEKENIVVKEPESKCYGTYQGSYSGKSEDGVATANYNYKYVLNKDGTFSADFSNISSKKGTFTINDNTISFTGNKEIGGPREEVPYYETDDYVISDDCSIIKIIVDDGNVMELKKQS